MPKSSLPPRRSYPVRIPKPKAEKGIDWIARINALTSVGRANWFGLLAYLTFTFVTVLGVEDADFFIASRQTQLPLVGVSIPTLSFFIFAPVLGLALYTYLHFHIRKIAAALSAPEPVLGGAPLEESLSPWLLNDLVLRKRGVGAVRTRPLDRLSDFVTLLLVWVAGPFVLGAIWTNSFVYHSFWLTSWAGACMFAATVIGCISWRMMEEHTKPRRCRAHAEVAQIYDRCPPLAAMILLYGFLATKGIALPFDQQNLPELLQGRLFAVGPDLIEAQLSVLPPDQADPGASRQKYRAAWCARLGHPALTCGTLPSAREPAAPYLEAERIDWCKKRKAPLSPEACTAYFSETDERFRSEWTVYRSAQIAALPKPDMSGKDLRNARMYAASLTGVNFAMAQMEGADLRWAQMEGANLRWAQMEGANLFGAQMEGADLSSAQMEGADLFGAQMEGADLSSAQMEGADLSSAQMEGADLRWAQMEGANLRWAQMEGANLSSAQMEGANLSGAELKSVNWAAVTNDGAAAQFTDFRAGIDLTQDVLSVMVGNARTLLPDAADPGTGALPYIPSCWAGEPEGWPVLVRNLARYMGTEEKMRDDFLCSAPDEVPCKTGTSWPADRDPPWVEAKRDGKAWVPKRMEPIDPDSDGVCRDEIEAAE